MLSFLFLVVFGQTLNPTSVVEIKTTDKTPISQSRWLYNENEPADKDRLYKKLRLVKKSWEIGNYKSCQTLSTELQKQLPALVPWLLIQKIKCLQGMAAHQPKKFKRLARSVLKSLVGVESLRGRPYDERIFEAEIVLRRSLLGVEAKTNDAGAHKTFQQLYQRRKELPKDVYAQILKEYGNFLMLRQKVSSAAELFRESLELMPDKSLAEKLGKIGKYKEKKESPSPRSDFLGEEGDKHLQRFRQALGAKDYMAALEDGVKLMQLLPGSETANEVQSVLLEIYLEAYGKPEFIEQVKEIISEMRSTPVIYQLEWGTHLYEKSIFADAAALLSNVVESPNVKPEIRLRYGKALYAIGNLDEAEGQFSHLVSQLTGGEVAGEALFLSGLIAIRNESYTDAVSRLERLLQIRGGDRFDLSAHYWLWRLLRKENAERAKKHEFILLKEYPFSYYALIVAAEKGEGKFDLPVPKEKTFSTSWHLSPAHFVHWKRAKMLLRAGWLEEARSELEQLPKFVTPVERLALARYWAAALDYRKSIRLVNQAWNEDSAFRAKNILKTAYPLEFKDEIDVHARIYSLRSELVRSLIRQESAFFVEAESRSGALGLMQLIPPTALEVSESLGMKSLKLPQDMFSPVLNIRFGTYYLAKMIRQHAGHIGLAIAAYNAGPLRLGRYLKARGLTAEQMLSETSEFADLWMDEIPWSETSFYVKAVLRNVVIYRTLYQGPIQFQAPYWRAAQLEAGVAE